MALLRLTACGVGIALMGIGCNDLCGTAERRGWARQTFDGACAAPDRCPGTLQEELCNKAEVNALLKSRSACGEFGDACEASLVPSATICEATCSSATALGPTCEAHVTPTFRCVRSYKVELMFLAAASLLGGWLWLRVRRRVRLGEKRRR